MPTKTIDVAALKTKMDWARAYAEAGYYVFPLQPDLKLPFIGSHSFHDASRHPALIEKWWTLWPDADIAIACFQSDIVVIDIDRHPDRKDGFEEFAKLEGYEPITDMVPSATTSQNGLHMLFIAPELRDDEHVPQAIVKGVVDIKYKGYFVAEPSTYNGKPYHWVEGKSPFEVRPPMLPEWLLKYAIKKGATLREGEENAAFENADDSEFNRERFRNWMKTPHAEELAARNKRFDVACIAWDFGLSENACCEEMAVHYNDKCDGDLEKLEDKVRHVYQGFSKGGAQGKFGNRNAALSDFADVEPMSDADLLLGLRAAVEFAQNRDEEDDFSPVIRAVEEIETEEPEEEDDDDYLPAGLVPAEQKTAKEPVKQKAKGILLSCAYDQEPQEDIRGDRDIARHVAWRYGNGNLLFSRQKFYRWNKRLWEVMPDRDIRKTIGDMMEKLYLNKNISNKKVASVLDLLKDILYKPDSIFEIKCNAVVCENCELVYEDQTGKWTPSPHVREHYHLNALPVKFDKDAEAPRFESYMQDVFEGDMDQADKVKCSEQFMGYCLRGEYQLHNFLLLEGCGRNGKNVYIDVVNGLLGKANICHVDPSQFENQFQLGHMHGKLANTVEELSKNHDISDDKIKKLTAGGSISAEEKHRPPFDFKATAKQLYGANGLPHLKDTSPAFRERVLILKYNWAYLAAGSPTPPGARGVKPRTLGLAQKMLKEELPGILNVALRGAKSLIDEEKFCEPRSSIEMKDEWLAKYDQLGQFVGDCGTLTGKCVIDVLYLQYLEWAKLEGIRSQYVLKKRSFGAELKSRYGVVSIPGTNGGGKRYSGISIDPDKLEQNSIPDVRTWALANAELARTPELN